MVEAVPWPRCRSTVEGGCLIEPVAGASLIAQASAWVRDAIQAASNKAQQRRANLLGDVAFLVAALRDLDRRFHRIFVPLVYFEPDSWSSEKRQQWVDDLTSFVFEDRVMSRVNATLSSLASRPGEARDPVQGLVDELITTVQSVLLQEDEHHGTPTVERPGGERPDWVAALSSRYRGPDAGVAPIYQPLSHAILTASDEGSARWLRSLARNVMGMTGEPLSLLDERDHQSMAGSLPRSPVKPAADQSTVLLGAIIAAVQEEFPAVPTPDWVWA